MSWTKYRLAALLTGCLFYSARADELPVTPGDRILVVAAHPDDDVLCCGGLIQDAVQRNIPIQIVYLTYGDYNKWSFTVYHKWPVFRAKTMRAMGELRRREAIAAASVLGVPADRLIFLGYPDMGTRPIWDHHWGETPAFESTATRVSSVPYPTAYRPHAPYTGDAILQDLRNVIQAFQPTRILAPHPADIQQDHAALSLFTRRALESVEMEIAPTVQTYLIHYSKWPRPRGAHLDTALTVPPPLHDSAAWQTWPLSPEQRKQKWAALKKHKTQYGYSAGFMKSFVRSNELFSD